MSKWEMKLKDPKFVARRLRGKESRAAAKAKRERGGHLPETLRVFAAQYADRATWGKKDIVMNALDLRIRGELLLSDWLATLKRMGLRR